MRLGAHVSIAGGMDRAPARAAELDFGTFQVFTKSNQQWRARPLSDAEIEEFRRRCAEDELTPVVGHSAYLLNLASGDPELWQRSCDSCRTELERSARLGLDGLVIHPGAHGGDGESVGLDRIARAIERIYRRLDAPPLLLETTAGQGTSIGHRLEHLAWLLERFTPEVAGVCLDSCHLHAAGYPLGDPDSVRRTLDAVGRVVGWERVRAIHLNDSVKEAGSRRDRHAGIGDGTIGESGFRALLSDRRVRELPGILETPKGEDNELDRRNLARLRALLDDEPLPDGDPQEEQA